MNILWSKVEGETEFVLAFPGAEQQQLIFTAAAQSHGGPIFRHITTIAQGNEPVLFTRSGTEPIRLQSSPLGSAGAGARTQEIDVNFKSSLKPMQAQLFLARVSARNVVFQTGPRIAWPQAHPSYDPAQAAQVATAIRATDAFQDFLRRAERLREGSETIFISATPLSTEQPGAGESTVTSRMTVAPALDLWPHLFLSGTLQVVRESNRNEMPRARSALEAEYSGKTQLFRDEIKLDITGDLAVAQSLWLCHVRRQAVAGYELLARAEPEVGRMFAPRMRGFQHYPLAFGAGENGGYTTNVANAVVARGDWFFLVSPDAELTLEWLEDPDGNRYPGVRSFPLGHGTGPSVNVIAWRHDGRTVTTLPDAIALDKTSSEVSRGLIADALKRWSDSDRNFSIFGLWGTLLNALKPPPGVPPDKRRDEFEKRIIGEHRRARRRLLSQHSPFVGLAALARWLALDRAEASDPGKSGERWQAGLGNDDGGSIDRLLSPVAEWLVQNRGAAVSVIAPTDTNSDVVDDFLRWARGADVALNYPRNGRSPDPALALLLLLDTALAEQAEKFGVVLTLAEAGDQRAHDLIRAFARIFFPDPLDKLIARRDADFGFYRGVMLPAGRTLTDGERRMRSLYDGPPADPPCTIEDLNGGPLDHFDTLAKFDEFFGKLTEAFRHLGMEADANKGVESLTDLRASIASAHPGRLAPRARDVAARDLRDVPKRIATKYKKAFTSQEGAATFVRLIDELAKPGRDARDRARRALVLKRLRLLEGELNRAYAKAHEKVSQRDPDYSMAEEERDKFSEEFRSADSDPMKEKSASDRFRVKRARAKAKGPGLRVPDTALEPVLEDLRRDFDLERNRLTLRRSECDVAEQLDKTAELLDRAFDLLRRFTNTSLKRDLREVDELDDRLTEQWRLVGEIKEAIAALRLI
jgi:hypothetical protein